ncbi:MAG: FHA domain-containing protein [Pseudomonadales bacterium]
MNETTQLRARIEPEPVNRPVARIELENGIGINVLEASLPLTIGRSGSCDISIPSGHVSRRHCEIYLVNGVLCLKDTSSNGTTIGNRTIRKESVSIKGRTTLLFADEVQLSITPAVATEIKEDDDRRRREERRGDDRRQKSVVVSFERRSDRERRDGDRRFSR